MASLLHKVSDSSITRVPQARSSTTICAAKIAPSSTCKKPWLVMTGMMFKNGSQVDSTQACFCGYVVGQDFDMYLLVICTCDIITIISLLFLLYLSICSPPSQEPINVVTVFPSSILQLTIYIYNIHYYIYI